MRSPIASSVYGSSACAKVARVVGVAGNYSAVPNDIEAIVLGLCEVYEGSYVTSLVVYIFFRVRKAIYTEATISLLN